MVGAVRTFELDLSELHNDSGRGTDLVAGRSRQYER